MTVWLIEPQDPLIVRDGRPFHATPGARARSLPFPFPSTTAGGVRTRAGQDDDGIFDTDQIATVRQISVRGPLLVELNEYDAFTFLAPAPADAIVFGNKDGLWRKQLCTLNLTTGVEHDDDYQLPYLAGLPTPDGRKPAKEAPTFWRWPLFEDWLLKPGDDIASLAPIDLGHDGPQVDRRVHVAIDPGTFTGIDSALFLTRGLTFWHQPQTDMRGGGAGGGGGLSQTSKLALAVDVANLNELTIAEGLAYLGGERRLMAWQQPLGLQLPDRPSALTSKVTERIGYYRLILLTPAYFEAGWQPAHFGQTADTTVTLQAAAVGKPVVVSGWDFELGQPKASRRLAPAGSVYFVKVEGDVQQWVQDRWLQSLSDDEELARVGFGLTAVGLWDGKALPMQVGYKEEQNG